MAIRKQLGDFNSIVCFKAVVVGVEETLGVQAAGVALKAAGRKRGRALVESLGLAAARADLGSATAALRDALGAEGTRLCHVEAIEERDGGYLVHLAETVCSAGEPAWSKRELTFTLGAVHGALETIVGKKLRARQVGSVLAGQAYDTVELLPA